MPETDLKRLVAIKTSINKLADIPDIGARINLIGTLVEKDVAGGFKNFILDDGTAHIMVGLFEEQDNFLDDFDIGCSIMVIGRLRDYLGDRYVVGEIIKKVDDKNILFMRNLELKIADLKYARIRNDEKLKLKILDLVRFSDSGGGVFIEEIMKKINLDNVESLISKMLESGELFQIKPGVVRVME